MQARTYPDLLKSPHDEELFEYYCQSNLIYIKVRSVLMRANSLRGLKPLQRCLACSVKRDLDGKSYWQVNISS